MGYVVVVCVCGGAGDSAHTWYIETLLYTIYDVVSYGEFKRQQVAKKKSRDTRFP